MSDWVEYVVAEGRAARKWFGDHYKEVHVAPSGDFEGAKASVDRDVSLRAEGAVNASRAEADALRKAADVADPDVEPPAPESEPAPGPETTEAVAEPEAPAKKTAKKTKTAEPSTPEPAPAPADNAT